MSAALPGCVHPRDRVMSTPLHLAVDERADAPPASPGPRAMHGPYDFHWRLSGERQAGPSQVFNTSEGVWLYFDRDLRLPVVFGSNQAGNDVLLRPVHIPPYLFVQGDWSRLVFRLGHLVALAVKHTHVLPREAQSLVQPSTPPSTPPSADTSTPPSADPGSRGFRASPDDRNMRRVLKRWAESAGWTFGFDHWTLDVDIPVSASADLGSDFTAAVRALLASTEMSDRPAQPCFYTNKVLRVIGASQQCDPRRHPAGTVRKQAAR